MTKVMCDLRRSCALPNHQGPFHASKLKHAAATTAARIAQALCGPVRLGDAVGRLRRARRPFRTACSASGIRNGIAIAIAIAFTAARAGVRDRA